jgi:hypothetical protein
MLGLERCIGCLTNGLGGIVHSDFTRGFALGFQCRTAFLPIGFKLELALGLLFRSFALRSGGFNNLRHFRCGGSASSLSYLRRLGYGFRCTGYYRSRRRSRGNLRLNGRGRGSRCFTSFCFRLEEFIGGCG